MELHEKEPGKLPATLRDEVQGVAKRFTSAKQIGDFLLEERNFHSELARMSPKSAARNVVATLPGSPVSGPAEDEAPSLDVYLTELRRFAQVCPPVSTGRYGPLLKQISEADPGALEVAYNIVAKRVGTEVVFSKAASRAISPDIEYQRYSFVLEMAEALRTDRQLAKATQQAAATVAEDAKNVSAAAEELSIIRDNYERETRETLAKFMAVSERTVAEFENQCRDTMLATTTALNEHKQSSLNAIEALRDQLEAHMITEAPTKYWSDKSDYHGRIAIGAGVAFAAVLFGAIGLFIWRGLAYLTEATRQFVETSPDSALAAFAPLVFVTVPTLAIAWVLRHISRVIIQNLSLQADAKLRGTIAHTYLALTAKEKPSEAQLAIALQALFRPLDGSEHAEVAPPNLAEIFKLMPSTK